ncbi:MAG: hypothetical protein AAB289_14245, partial [Chloroflexota bacterium]
VLFLWEPRSYLCRVECQPDPLHDNWRYAEYVNGNDIDRTHTWMRSQGYTHLMLFGGNMRRFAEARVPQMDSLSIESLTRFEARHLERIDGPGLIATLAAPSSQTAGGFYSVYRLRPASPRPG